MSCVYNFSKYWPLANIRKTCPAHFLFQVSMDWHIHAKHFYSSCCCISMPHFLPQTHSLVNKHWLMSWLWGETKIKPKWDKILLGLPALGRPRAVSLVYSEYTGLCHYGQFSRFCWQPHNPSTFLTNSVGMELMSLRFHYKERNVLVLEAAGKDGGTHVKHESGNSNSGAHNTCFLNKGKS